MRTLHVLMLVLFMSLDALGSAAAQDFTLPSLTGRVVDSANILGRDTERELSQFLENHENATTNQVVVVTLPSLQGHSIERYGVELGRHWGIGQESKDNGVILVVAPNEKKVRIEVGYGLEGILTDASAKTIIERMILPRFREGNMNAGVRDGTMAIIAVLGGEVQQHANIQNFAKKILSQTVFWFLLVFVFVLPLFMALKDLIWPEKLSKEDRKKLTRDYRYGRVTRHVPGHHGRASGGFGGGFSGGGGGFGGGGASGGW